MLSFFRHIRFSFITVLFGVQFSVVLNSAAQTNLPEKFMMQTDRNIFLSGETIFYKIYNTNYHKLNDHSKVVYVNFHDKKGALSDQQKLRLENGEAHGSITIPVTFQEGYYYVTCFTKWNLQFEKNPVEALKLAIYNPYESTSGKSDEISNTPFTDKRANPANINIELQDSPYRTREKSFFRIRIPNGVKGSVSVSVHLINSLNKEEYNLINKESNLFTPMIYYKTEAPVGKEQNLQIDGSVIDPKTQTPLISDVLSLYKAGGSKFYRIPDLDGQVSSNVADFSGEAQFQIFNMNPYQTEVPEFNLKTAGEKLLGLDSAQAAPPRNEAINRYIKNALLSQKIHEIFEEKTIDSLEGTVQSEFPFRADKVYLMEKYKGMKTFEEFIREIVTYAEVLEKDDKATVRLKNRQTKQFFMEKPWYLVDGYLTRDEEAVLNIPFKNLIRAELFYTDKTILEQLETVMIRSGMIAVYTDNYYLNDQLINGTNIFTYKGFSESEHFEGADPASKEESRENPDFTNLIYWNPEIKADGQAKIEFVTSDLTGDYVIEIKGTDENGQILSGAKTFSVTY